jgi:hypothetical protein
VRNKYNTEDELNSFRATNAFLETTENTVELSDQRECFHTYQDLGLCLFLMSRSFSSVFSVIWGLTRRHALMNLLVCFLLVVASPEPWQMDSKC